MSELTGDGHKLKIDDVYYCIASEPDGHVHILECTYRGKTNKRYPEMHQFDTDDERYPWGQWSSGPPLLEKLTFSSFGTAAAALIWRLSESISAAMFAEDQLTITKGGHFLSPAEKEVSK